MRGWLDFEEVGGALGIRLLILACTVFGRAFGRVFLYPVALYYSLLHKTARSASRNWLRRVHSGGPGSQGWSWRMTYLHVLRFARVTLDRLFLIRTQMWRFEIRIHGDRHMRKIRASNQGVVFLGAHLGSFEAIRALANVNQTRVNVVGYFRNAKMINAALERLDPDCAARLIEIQPGGIDFVFAVQDCIERGEHVAILGDRVGLGGATTEVLFLGRPVTLPIGIYQLAAVLRCPIYLIFALYSEPNRYDIYCEPFAERIELPRNRRSEVAAEYAQRYADRLAHYARLAPDNWFNFFDFWSQPPPAHRDRERSITDAE